MMSCTAYQTTTTGSLRGHSMGNVTLKCLGVRATGRITTLQRAADTDKATGAPAAAAALTGAAAEGEAAAVSETVIAVAAAAPGEQQAEAQNGK
jgi:hypothetical protein